VREGIVKHETEYDTSSAEGYEPEKRGSLEAQIANIADELTYTSHDLDDGLYAGLITPRQLDGLALWEMIKQSIGWDGRDFSEMIRHRLIRRLIHLEVHDAIEATAARLVEANPDSVDELQRLSYNVIGHGDEMAAMNRELKDFLYENMYRHHRVVRMQNKAIRFITQLFEMYIQDPDQLPNATQARLAEGADSLERVVCDYLAGMTDRYALQEYEKFFDPFARP
jgi:dGTPase